MPEIPDEKDRRVYPRVQIDREARAVLKEDVVEGAVGDISAGGIFLRTDMQLEIGQEVNLEIEGMSTVSGRVSRTLDGGFVITLALGSEEEDRFLAEVMQIQNNLEQEES